MEYLKANITKFDIAAYFKHIHAQFRETAEKDFKDFVAKIGKFEANAKNLPLLDFASRMRNTKFESLSSQEADDYWNVVLSNVSERKRVNAHLTSEVSVSDAILNYAKKRLKSKAVVETEEYTRISEQSSPASVNETNIWEVWSETIRYLDRCDDPSININEYSLEHLGIVQLGDKIGNNTTRELFAKSLVTPSNDIIRTTQKDIFKKYKSFYEEVFTAMELSLDDCEELLLKNCLRVKKSKKADLTFCYELFLIFVQQVFMLGGLDRLETLYILNRRRSCKVPITNKNCKDKLMDVINMMWELQEVVAESSAILKSIEESHKKNENTVDATKLESYLGETVDVKLSCSYVIDFDDVYLSSSPIRPSSACSNNSVNTDVA